MTLFKTVKCGKSWKSWKIMPKSCRMARRFAVDGFCPPGRVCSPMRISPSSTRARPLRQRSSVDLPPPEGPTMTTASPAGICSETPPKMVREPKDLRTFEIETANPAIYLPPQRCSKTRDRYPSGTDMSK